VLLIGILAPATANGQQKFVTIAQDMREREFADVRARLLAAAGRMPAELYSYRAAPEIRSFGEELGHAADVNFRLCGYLTGEDAPGRPAEGAADKSAILSRLRQSFELCDRGLRDLTDEQARKPTFGPYIMASHVSAMLGHNWSVYGKLTIMMRLNRIAPA
jgi:hypothetical protein